MQKYQSIISGTNGSVIRNVPVTVLKEDGSLAEIFMDREGQVQAPNPLVTDSRGVFYFYAKNGRYSLRTAADGVQITDADTVLLFDPDETASDGPIADAVQRAEDAAERAETALGDSGLQNMVQDAQDAAANAVQAVIDANQAVASIDAALIEAGEAKDAAQAAAQTAGTAASDAQAVKNSLLTYSGTLSATPEWSAVPAHEDLGLDAQTQAALNRIEKLKDDQQLLKQRADKSVLSYPDYAAASAAAATLPDGQHLEVQDGSGQFSVVSGSLSAVPEFDFQKNYAAGTVGAILHDAATNVRAFPWLAKVDGVTDDGAAIQAALNAKAAAGGGAVFIPGIAVSTVSITIPTGVTLYSVGRGYNKNPVGGILFKGTGTRNQSIPNATAITVANPDGGAAYLADSGTRGNTYSTIDFSANFSAAVILSPASGMRDIAVMPWFDGTDGYRGTDGRMADSWDVGIWARNSSGWRLNNVMSDGHWRKAGLLVSSSDIGDGKIPENELGEASFCLFGGARAVSIRTPRNTGVTNYGFAGTDFINCFFRSFDHQSAHLATSNFLAEPQATPSFCLEMDGPQALRGIQFLNCTMVGRDDGMFFFGKCDETLFLGCYQESRGIKIAGSWVSNTLGSRMVATSDSTSVFFHDNTKYGIDMSPYFTVDGSLTGQRYTQSGVFNPSTSQDSEWERPNFAASYGTRLRNGQAWRIYNSTFADVFNVSQTGYVTSESGALFKGIVTLSSDGVANLYAGSNPLVRRYGSGNIQIGSGAQVNADGTLVNTGVVRSSADNTHSLGSASYRWSTVFAGTGVINTSDAREKQQIRELSSAERAVAVRLKSLIRAFKFNDAVESKGNKARIHFGVIAQDVKAAFEEEGLVAEDYAILCYDEFDEQQEVIETWDDEFDDDGNLIRKAGGVVVDAYRPAGSRYGVRYEELLAFMIGAM